MKSHAENRERRALFAAAGFHAALFVIGAAALPQTPPRPAPSEPPALIAVTLESPVIPQGPGLGGGGSPHRVAAKDKTASPPGAARDPERPTSTNSGSHVEPQRRMGDGAHAPRADEPQFTMAALHAALDQRHADFEVAAAEAAAAEQGGRDVDVSPDDGHGAPAILGSVALGNGSGGALTGHVCFLPMGTLRIADVHGCSYVATLYTDTLDIPERQYFDGFPGVSHRSAWFLIDYTGRFTVSRDGLYDFRLHSDDGSYLYIDGTLVIDNDGKHPPESRSGHIDLAAGSHRIKVRYAQTDDRMALQLFVRLPNAQAEQIFRPQL